ncbi:MAG: hypothetical protein M3Q39_01455 [Actinomycetota bacterium]|nr:hypothetical protein [Actinomycetota bacterium]
MKRDYAWLAVAASTGAFAVFCSGLFVMNTVDAFEGDYAAAWMISGYLGAVALAGAIVAWVSWRQPRWGKRRPRG